MHYCFLSTNKRLLLLYIYIYIKLKKKQMKTLKKSDVIEYLGDINKKNEEFGRVILKSIEKRPSSASRGYS